MRKSGPVAADRAPPQELAKTYVGGIASEYEDVRHGQKWDSEHAVIDELLEQVDEGSRTLDVPIGTGRFLPHFQARKLSVIGLDASLDMLALAQATANSIGAKLPLLEGDIFSLPFDDAAFALVVCIRFLNLVNRANLERALRELVRVSADKLLIGIRYLVPARELNGRTVSALARRPMWFVRRLVRGLDVRVQDKVVVLDLLARFNLEVIDSRHVERSLDGTDYLLMLLQKRSEVAKEGPRNTPRTVGTQGISSTVPQPPRS